MKLWQQDIVTRNVFREDFAWYGGRPPKARPILVYKPTAINKRPILMSLWYFDFSKVYTETIQNSKHNLLQFKMSLTLTSCHQNHCDLGTNFQYSQ